jgi:conjugative transfer signal peptidase TraF
MAGACLIALGALCSAAGARVNTSRSIPVGLYWASSMPVEKGAYVMFCPPQAGVFRDARERGYIGGGLCPGGYGYLMKRVAAAGSDTVRIGDEGVRVNGRLLPHSAPRIADAAARPLPRLRTGDCALGDAELLLMSDVSDTSFDGRYFGLVDRSQVRNVIRPVLTWQGETP